jgi:hypothetical protein
VRQVSVTSLEATERLIHDIPQGENDQGPIGLNKTSVLTRPYAGDLYAAILKKKFLFIEQVSSPLLRES